MAFLPALPWLARNWSVTGNPFFPMLANVVPTRDWSPEHAEIFTRYIRYYTWGVAGAVSSESARRILVIATVVVVAIAAMVSVARIRGAAFRSLAIFGGVFAIIIIAGTGLVFRYWLPALLAGVIVAASLFDGLARARSWTAVRWLPSLLLCMALLGLLRKGLNRDRTFLGDLRLATGITTPSEEHASNQFWKTWSYLNAVTPLDAKVLMASFYTTFGASSYGGFWIDRTCFATDSQMQNFIRFDTWDSFLESIRRAKISHVVIGDGQFNRTRVGFEFPALDNEYPFSRRLVERHGEKVAQFGHMQVYQLSLQE
jgi:hypothetical protein